MKKFGLAIFLLLIVGIIFLLIDIVPPESQTCGAMNLCKRRIMRYAQKNGKLPESLKGLDIIEGFSNSIEDGWGVMLDYTFDDKAVKLTSIGKDRKLGGKSDDTDLTGEFFYKKPDGSWSDELVSWIIEPIEQFKTINP